MTIHDDWLPDAMTQARRRVLVGPADQRVTALAELEMLVGKLARHDERNRIAVVLGQAHLDRKGTA